MATSPSDGLAPDAVVDTLDSPMLFTSPIWLLLLAPWAGLVIWVLRGVGVWGYVPFLKLWPDDPARAGDARRLRRPSWDIVLILCALLLSILASAGLARMGPGAIRLIVDRGEGLTSVPRYHETVRRALEAIPSADDPVELQFVPGPIVRSTRRDAMAHVEAHAPTAVTTTSLLAPAIERARREFPGTILVVTTQNLEQPGERIVQVSPTRAADNVGIDRLVADRDAATRAMQILVSLRNDSPAQSVGVRVRSGDADFVTTAALASRGASSDLVLNLPAPARTISVSIDRPDDFPVDSSAYLAHAGAAIEVRPGLSPAVERVVKLIDDQRVARGSDAWRGSGQSRVIVTGQSTGLAMDEPGVEVVGRGLGRLSESRAVQLRVDWPWVTRVDWERVARDGWVAAEPDDTWIPAVRCDGRTLVAYRPKSHVDKNATGTESAILQVSVRCRSDDWTTRADFVLFWSGLLEALGAGSRWEALPVESVPLDESSGQSAPRAWRAIEQSAPTIEASPGVYQSPADAYVATRMRAISPGRFSDQPIVLPAGSGEAPVPLSRGLLALAVCLLPIAMLVRRWTGQT